MGHPATIRPATAGDWQDVAALLAELGRPVARGTEGEDAARRQFEGYLTREDAFAFVADVDGRVVGFIDVEVRTWMSFPVPDAWIPDLVVAEDARSRGIGAALLARAEEVGREHGCFAMRLESATWRERAHAFYEREGWAFLAKSFAKSLTDDQWRPAPR